MPGPGGRVDGDQVLADGVLQQQAQHAHGGGRLGRMIVSSMLS
jgi:hypothetical protein